jgi:glycosyltransferase involved in cell wall biosynthesis
LIVLPSRWFETGPLTLLEAWDCGVPVLGTDLGGIAEFTRAQNLTECLFALEDSQAIVAAVQRVLGWRKAAPTVAIPGMDDLGPRMSSLYESCVRAQGTRLG